MWKIGDVEISNRLVAAPLAGISNPVYRNIAHQYGAGLVVSEMISDKALHYQSKKTFEMCRIVPGEHPVSLQLFGGDPVTMGEASRYLTEHTDCDIIDINMGCPVTKVLKAHAGSYLLQYPELASDIVKAVKDNTDKPVTVKIRAGYDFQHICCDRFAMKMEQAGADAIAIHGRTRSQMYTGKSNLDYIRMVKEAVRVPVIGNGDITTIEDAERMFEETHVDAIMIGRGLIGRPFFLSQLHAHFACQEYTEPSYEEKLALCYSYARDLCAYETERIGIHQMRSIAPCFIGGLPFAAKYKVKMCNVNSLEELQGVLDEYKEVLENL